MPSKTSFRRFAVLAAVLAAAGAVADAAEYGSCGEDTAVYACTGAVDLGTITAEVDPPQPQPGEPVRLTVRFEAVPLGADADCQAVVLWRREANVDGPVVGISMIKAGGDCPGSPGAPPGAPIEVKLQWEVGPLTEGVHVVHFGTGSIHHPPPEYRFVVAPPAGILRLRGGRVGVIVDRGLENGSSARAAAVALTDESGTFSFFGSSNVEVTVKVLDGRAINGHFWVFAASMTDRPYTLTVIDGADGCLDLPGDPLAHCPLRRYQAPAGQNRNFIDTAAF
jgi:hypothetical protein